MKEITIDGKIFKEIDFYQGEEQQKVFQLAFWRPAKFKTVPKLVFTVKEDIESITLTAGDVLRLIRRKIELIDRLAQIERGEILPTQTEKQNGFMGSQSIYR